MDWSEIERLYERDILGMALTRYERKVIDAAWLKFPQEFTTRASRIRRRTLNHSKFRRLVVATQAIIDHTLAPLAPTGVFDEPIVETAGQLTLF